MRHPEKKPSIYAIAIHEAGHAVLSVILGLGCREVTILVGDRSLGHLQTQWSEDEDDMRLYPEAFYIRHAIVSFAGVYAEMRWRPEVDPKNGAGKDFRDVSDALNALVGNGDQKALKGLEAYARSRTAFLIQHYWPEVKLVAQELRKRKTLAGDEVAKLISDSTLARKAMIISR